MVMLLGLLTWQFQLVAYGIMQARGQIKVVLEAQPIEDVLADPSFPDSLKDKLRIVPEIRRYCFDELGMVEAGNYQKVFDQKGKVTLWNLSASEPFQLKAKTWSFPFLGSFPYKGFFDLEEAKKEWNMLKAEGFDTRIRPVSGWSTLGWFDDPILSNMLFRPVGQLAELIIHELTHGTLYVKDSADYNENLATFIGEKGAEKFLAGYFGESSPELREYIDGETDTKKFINHFILGARSLDSLYNSMQSDIPVEQKQKLKHDHIQLIVDRLDTIRFNIKDRYTDRFNEALPNNAFFMSFLRYHSMQDILEEELENDFGGEVRTYLNYLKEKYPSL